jgi:hypothetical protein
MSLRFVSDAHHRRVLVKMAFPFTTRAINISTQPGIVSQALAAAGAGEDAPSGTRHAVVGGWVCELATAVGAWHPGTAQATSLDTVVGGAAFPVLGAAYERHVRPLREIPMWAAPILGQPTARSATEVAFGAKATRPVVSAFASSLTRPGPGAPHRDQPSHRVNLTALALALMGSAVLEPDQLARVLRRARPAAVPSGEQISAAQRALGRLGRHRAERVLTDAGEADDGLMLLTQTVEMFAEVGHLLPGRAANRLEALHAQCRELMPRNPNPRSQVTGPSRRARRAPRPTPPPPPQLPALVRPARAEPVVTPRVLDIATAPPAQERGHHRAYAPPPVTSAPTNPALRFPTDIQALDHTELGGLRLVLPRTTYELTVWGQLLANCIGSFGLAAAAGLSWLIGVEVGERLAYCLELSANRSVRQFLGPRNRPVPAHHAQRVLEHLARCRVVDASDPVNRLWYP